MEKKGKGTTLADLEKTKIKGGIVGLCGANACDVCGYKNHSDLNNSYHGWERTDMP